MTINKIYGDQGIGPMEGAKRSRQTDTPKKAENSDGTDRVDFSSVLSDVNRVREAANTPDAARAQRVQELKAQVASGSYRPDLEKVASSLLNFIAGNK